MPAVNSKSVHENELLLEQERAQMLAFSELGLTNTEIANVCENLSVVCENGKPDGRLGRPSKIGGRAKKVITAV